MKAAPHLFLSVCLPLGEAKPAVDMVDTRGRGRIRRQTCLCSSLSILAAALGVGGAHVRVCVCCVASSSGVIGVSKVAVHFFVVLVVCHRGAGWHVVLFDYFAKCVGCEAAADVVCSGVSGVVPYLGLSVAVRNQGEARQLCIRAVVGHRYAQPTAFAIPRLTVYRAYFSLLHRWCCCRVVRVASAIQAACRTYT